MYIIKLDENKYFTGSYAKRGSIEGGIAIDSLPPDLSNHKTTCWKREEEVSYQSNQVPVIDETTQEQKVDDEGNLVFRTETIKIVNQIWKFDEEKHKKILDGISKEESKPTQEQLIKELQVKNIQLESTLDTLMTEIIPNIMG